MTIYTAQTRSSVVTQDDEGRAVYRKVFRRVIPLLFVSQIFAFLDRVNIGFAQAHMARDLGLSAAQYGFAAGVFFLGIMLLEIPANLWLHRFGARKSLFRIMFLWGIVSSATMFVRTPHELVLMRFLLGLCEAGFWPGVLLYLTYWFPSARRAHAVAVCLLAPTVAGIIAGPLSGWILGTLDGMHGLHGWQWMFLIEGAPACMVAWIVRFRLPDGPDGCEWLTPGERALIARALSQESDTTHASATWSVLDRAHWRMIVVLSFVLACTLSCVFLNVFWLPVIIREAGIHDDLQIGLYSVVPYIASGIAMVLISRHSDSRGERRWHFAGSMGIAATGLAILGYAHATLWLALPGLCLLAMGTAAALAVFWSLPPVYLPRAALPGAIALINMVGGVGALLGPSVMGVLRERGLGTSLSMVPFGVLALCAAGVLIWSTNESRVR